MADDSRPSDEPMRYHPADSPRGTLFYNLEELTADQQMKLNALKIDTIREDEKYLAAHPEIRAVTVLMLRVLLRRRPMMKVHEFVAKFFNRPESDIADDVQAYLDARKDHVYEDLSAVEISLAKRGSKLAREESVPDRPIDFICAEECVCDHAMDWKLPLYEAHDDSSYMETEHWLTPKSSKTSMTLDDSLHGGTTDEYFSLTDLARMMGVGEGEYEEVEGMVVGDFGHDEDEEVSEDVIREETFEEGYEGEDSEDKTKLREQKTKGISFGGE